MNEYMNQALQLAREAANEGEVPVGAVVVKDGIVIATGRNRREQGKNALCHAEIEGHRYSPFQKKTGRKV